MATPQFQKQSARNLLLSANTQATYGTPLPDANLTQRQRFDPGSVFTRNATFRTDKEDAGKGTEFATNSQITAWDTMGTLKAEADGFLMGWMLAMIFGQELVTGTAPTYTHTFTIPAINATMPATTLYIEETSDQKFKLPDMAAKSLSIDVPERGSVMVSLDMVGTGLKLPGALVAAVPAIPTVAYLLGSDVTITLDPTPGAPVPFTGRQRSLSIKVDRGSAPYKCSGDGLYASSVQSGVTKFSVDMQIAALATDDVNGWFENQVPLTITIATNPALSTRFVFTFPNATVKANKLGNSENKVVWAISFDEEVCTQVGAQAAINAFAINNVPSYLVQV